MEWMLDTANLEEIRAGLEIFPVAGVTTNPTILRAARPANYFDHLRGIRQIIGSRTLHVQVGGEGHQAMLAQAEAIIDALGREVYLKVPVTEEGLRVIAALKKQGLNVTATAIYSVLQGMLAISAGADYLAPYCNRMEQNDIDYEVAVAQLRNMIDRDGYDAKILAASFKNAGQIARAIDSGAHAVTAAPALLSSALRSPLVVDAVRVFGEHQAEIWG